MSSSSSGGALSSSNTQACASCKHQRKRCTSDCPMAKYFPAEREREFQNCKKLFGVSNMLRMLKEAQTERERENTIKSLIFEADVRQQDPVHGCLGFINQLKEQIAKLNEELALTRGQVHYILQHQLRQQQFPAVEVPSSCGLDQQQSELQGEPPSANRAIGPGFWL